MGIKIPKRKTKRIYFEYFEDDALPIILDWYLIKSKIRNGEEISNADAVKFLSYFTAKQKRAKENKEGLAPLIEWVKKKFIGYNFSGVSTISPSFSNINGKKEKIVVSKFDFHEMLDSVLINIAKNFNDPHNKWERWQWVGNIYDWILEYRDKKMIGFDENGKKKYISLYKSQVLSAYITNELGFPYITKKQIFKPKDWFDKSRTDIENWQKEKALNISA